MNHQQHYNDCSICMILMKQHRVPIVITAVKPDELVQLRLFEDCPESFINVDT